MHACRPLEELRNVFKGDLRWPVMFIQLNPEMTSTEAVHLIVEKE